MRNLKMTFVFLTALLAPLQSYALHHIPVTTPEYLARAYEQSLSIDEIDWEGLKNEARSVDRGQFASELIFLSLQNNTPYAWLVPLALNGDRETLTDSQKQYIDEAIEKQKSSDLQKFRSSWFVVNTPQTLALTEEALLSTDDTIFSWLGAKIGYSQSTLEFLKNKIKDPLLPAERLAFYQAHLLLQDVTNAPPPTPPSGDFFDVIRNGNPIEFYAFMLQQIKLLKFAPLEHNKVVGALDLVFEILFGDTSEGYAGGAITSANEGIINYLHKQLDQSPTRVFNSLRFYSAIAQPYLNHSPEGNPHPLIWEKSSANAWGMALNATQGDRLEALKTLSVFGHDDCCNQFWRYWKRSDSSLSGYIDLLNTVVPSAFHDMRYPGSLAGLNVPEYLLTEYQDLYKRAQELNSPVIQNDGFWAIYYHVYGGMLMTTELVSHGYDKTGLVRIPVLLSELMGYYYKKIANEYSYIPGNGPDAVELYKKGYKHYKQPLFPKPKQWDWLRFKNAKLLLDIRFLELELTTVQHRMGAEWAFDRLAK
ncbi:hypothetical protein WDW86_06915 [Bdellovibrionota bacterium FG-2]